MNDNLNPQNPPQSSPTPATPPAQQLLNPSTSQRSYLAMILLHIGLVSTGISKWYIGDSKGKTRFIIWIIAVVLLLIPGVNILAALVILAFTIWGYFELPSTAKRTHDTEGQPFMVSGRDKKIANRVIKIYVAFTIFTWLSFPIGFIIGFMGGFTWQFIKILYENII